MAMTARRGGRGLVLLAGLGTGLMLLAGTAAGGSAEEPEITDALGDAGPEGTSAPAGFAWGDIAAAWFTDDAEALRVHILVAEAAGPPADGEVAVVAQAGERGFVFGWSSFLNLVPPVPVRTGFVCDLAADGSVAVETCEGLEGATVGGDLYAVPVPRARLGSPPAGTVVEAWAYSEHFVGGMRSVPVDRTGPGTPYALTAGPAPPTDPPAGEPEEQDTPREHEASDPSLRPTSAPGPGDADRATPVPAALAVMTALGLAAGVRNGLGGRRR